MPPRPHRNLQQCVNILRADALHVAQSAALQRLCEHGHGCLADRAAFPAPANGRDDAILHGEAQRERISTARVFLSVRNGWRGEGALVPRVPVVIEDVFGVDIHGVVERIRKNNQLLRERTLRFFKRVDAGIDLFFGIVCCN